MSQDLQALFERCASLVFDLEAFVDTPGELLRRPVGSGIFIAACQALTARHVVTDMHNVNPGRADNLRRRQGYHLLPYHGSASQIVDVTNPNRSAEWGLTNVWPDSLTDIATLQFAPIDANAVEMMNRMSSLFPKWSLLPPPSGASVAMLGQPRDQVSPSPTASHTLTYLGQPGIVMENFETRLVRGMYDFPCFTVSHDVPHGMSGGPVFWGDLLCGVVSGGWNGRTVVAALWPLCLTEFENPSLGALNKKTSFESLLDSRQIEAVDWDRVKGNVSFGEDGGKNVALLRPPER